MATKKKADSVDQAEPTFSKEQLVKSETLGLPRDAVAAILKDGQQYAPGTGDPACDRIS